MTTLAPIGNEGSYRAVAIREWSNDLISGFEALDAQHESLFNMVNTFVKENDKHTSHSTVVHFAEKLITCCQEHFDYENRLMEIIKYPLLEHHTELHTGFIEEMVGVFHLFESDREIDPYHYIVDASTKWFHHVVRDDLTLFYHYRDKEAVDNSSIVGRACEVYTMDNKLCSYGKVSTFSDNGIVIECRHEYVSLIQSDLIKVSVNLATGEHVYFITKVHRLKGNMLILYRAAVIKTENDREYYRITANLDAQMTDMHGNVIAVNIVDVGGGGMLLETEVELQMGDEEQVAFSLVDTPFTTKCKVVRKYKKNAALYHYGMQFSEMVSIEHNRLLEKLYQLQLKRNWTLIQ
jgi:hemerythrin-like metal-binding protein